MSIGPDNLGNGSATQERFAGQYRKSRREASLTAEPPAEAEPAARNGLPAGRESAAQRPGLPSLDMGGLAEPVYPPPGWNGPPTDLAAADVSAIADHPLLRGLLLELPPKGTVPAPGWLDRWFEAARSILELLYLQDADRRLRSTAGVRPKQRFFDARPSGARPFAPARTGLGAQLSVSWCVAVAG